jgi:hypothetical protein
MKFNEAKCKILHIGRHNPKYSYTMNGTTLDSTTCEKDVGVYINDDLKPSTQCSKAASKASTVLGMMGRSFHYRNKTTWINLYKAYVRPHLEYASPVWNPWYVKDISALEKIQERAVRMCSGLKSNTYENKLKEVGLDTLVTRREKIDLTQVWKILHGFDNLDESIFFSRLRHNTDRTTRAASSEFNLMRTHCNLDVRRHFFSNRIIESWNSLPESIKAAPTINSFKSRLEEYFSDR